MTEVTLLDGGMGQELIARSGQPAAPLWATQVMIDRPGLVGEVHRDYAEAGATVATTNTYALHRDRLRGGSSNHYAADGVFLPDLEDQFETLFDLALTEVETVRTQGRVAGSIGPLGASYRADLLPEHEVAVALFAEIAGLLAPRVDLLLFETIPSVEAAKAALAAGLQTGKPVWLSFTVDDEDGSLLRSGEPVSEAAEVAREADAVLANCSAPEAMARALDALSGAQVPIGAYANAFQMITNDFLAGGTTAQDLQAREDMVPETFARYALGLLDHGATILGGCCETSPAHIAKIAERLREEGHTIA